MKTTAFAHGADREDRLAVAADMVRLRDGAEALRATLIGG